ncbi:MAG: A/G-specific adenine glycosylase [Eubacteriales bacterium]|nr:A/G-specific adenine glycosylase [Eubacteriales bacterium]
MDEQNWAALSAIAQPLLFWYDRGARILPWRSNPTPYYVWVSEIMLQQTRVEAVKPYFDRFVREIPDIGALCAVDDAALMKLWQGLGYYNRARNLKKAGQIILECHGGSFPQDYDAIRALPGIGDYTAGAIASIAFGQAVSAVDGNVLRVFARLLGSGVDVTRPAVKRQFAAQIQRFIPRRRPGDFNQALMELGATLCLPNGQPRCGECPLMRLCRAYALGIADTLPVKPPKKPRRREELTVFVLRDGQRRIALRPRPDTGLLAGTWEYPNVPGRLTRAQAARQLRQWGLPAAQLRALAPAKHVFTHVQWHMCGYEVSFADVIPAPTGWIWCGADEIRDRYAIASAFRSFTDTLDPGAP